MVYVKAGCFQGVLRRAAAACAIGSLTAPGGCGALATLQYAPLFVTPLTIDGADVGDAIVDTGGAYEVILRDDFGLELVDTVEVLGFGGPEHVAVTEPFPYAAGGVSATAEFALIGLSACDCNGVGFRFFRKTQTVLGLDFSTMTARHSKNAPPGGANIEFAAPPPELPDFDSAFMHVEVTAGGETKHLLALLDTGTNGTVIRRGLFNVPGIMPTDWINIQVAREELGTVSLPATLFDTSGLPDIILGTDVMGVWSDRWYFSFAPTGGSVTIFPRLRGPGATE